MRKSTKKTKNVAILFSGGLDSTYLAYKNLKDGNRVTPYYIEILNNINKSKIEKQQMAKIAGALRQEFGDLMEYPRYASKNELWLNHWDSSLKFKQTPIWILSTLYMDQHFDEIQIGYVANDDSIPYITQIKETYKSLGWLLNEGKHRPALTFPLFQTPKYEMIDALPHNLKSLIFSCEDPMINDDHEVMNEDTHTFYRGNLMEFFQKDNEDRPIFLNHEPCGHCDPCKKILSSEHLYNHYQSNQSVFKKIKIKSVIENYDQLMKDVRYNEETKTMFNDINRVRQYYNTVDYKEPVSEAWSDFKDVALLDKNDNVELTINENGAESREVEKEVDCKDQQLSR